MKNIFVFPFTAEQIPLTRFQSALCRDNNIVPIVPSCIKIPNANLSMLDNGDDIDLKFVDWKNAQKNDIFCFVCGDGSINSYEFGVKFAKEVMSIGHSVEIHLDRMGVMRLKTIDNDFLQDNKICFPQKVLDIQAVDSGEKAQLFPVGVPVIAVGSIVAENNKKEVCLSLLEYYRDKGKRVECVFSDSIYRYLGLHILDYEALFENGIDLMIYYINNYFYRLQKKTECDMIICDLPGGMMKYSSELIDSAGVYSYIISQAIEIQKVICCVPLSYNTIEYYQTIADVIHQKFDVKEIFFHMSNYLVDTKRSPISERMPGCFIDRNDYISMLDFVNQQNSFIYNLRNREELEKALYV